MGAICRNNVVSCTLSLSCKEALMQATSMSPTGHCKDVLAHSAPTLRMPYQMLAGSQAVPGSQVN
eukprot:6473073-Amphidinium_carterae.1